MTADVLLEELRHRGVSLTADGAHLQVDAPKNALTPKLLDAMRAHKSALIRHLQAQPPATPSPNRDTPPETSLDDHRALAVDFLEDLRQLVNTGKLDGRHLVVLDCPRPDIGRVIREQFGHFDNAAAEGLNPGYFENRLKEIHRALESEAQA
jgi:hypothetical protein